MSKRSKKTGTNGDGHPAAAVESRLAIGGNALVGTTAAAGRVEADRLDLGPETGTGADSSIALQAQPVPGEGPFAVTVESGPITVVLPDLAARVAELEARLEQEAEWRKSVERATNRVDGFALEMIQAKEAAKEATECWRASVSDLTVITRSWKRSKEVAARPVIAAIEQAQERALAGSKAVAEVPAEDAWRLAPISVLAIPDGIREALEAIPFRTLGHLADWSRDNDGFRGIPKIGPKKQETLADAFADYFSEHGIGGGVWRKDEDSEPEHPDAIDLDAPWSGSGGLPATLGDAADEPIEELTGA